MLEHIMGTEKIIISACLAGQAVRYNGSAKTLEHPYIMRWRQQGRLVTVCPEMGGGLSVPRLPAEIMDGQSGQAVLNGKAEVWDNQGADLTEIFIQGAYYTLNVARQNNCRFALLTDASPSCGSRLIYDGSFSSIKHSGQGVTTALLRQYGIQVFSEFEVDKLYQLIG